MGDLVMPDYEDLDPQRVPESRLTKALTLAYQRNDILTKIRDKFQKNLQNSYLNLEDANWKAIITELEAAKTQIKAQQTRFQSQVNQTQETAVASKEDAIRKEIETLQSQLALYEEKITTQVTYTKDLNDQKAKLIEGMDISALNKLEIPEKDNKLGILYNWIIGCLFNSKKGIKDLCEELKIDVPKPQPPPVVQPTIIPQPQSIFTCGSKKPLPPPPKPKMLSEQEYKEQEYILCWTAFKNYIFSEQGKLLQKIKVFDIQEEKEPFKWMLTEELISEKQHILKSIFEIDIKDQIRMIISVAEVTCKLSKIYKERSITDSREREEYEKLELQMRSRNEQLEILEQQQEIMRKKKASVSTLTKLVETIDYTIHNKVTGFEKNIRLNDKEAQDLEVQIRDIETDITMKEFEIQEQWNRQEIEKNQREESERRQKEKEEEKKQKEEDEKHRLQVEQEEVQQSNIDIQSDKNANLMSHQDRDSESDYDEEQGDSDEEQQMPLDEDPILQNIQKTLYPHLLKTEKNKQKQAKQGGSIFQIMQKNKNK